MTPSTTYLGMCPHSHLVEWRMRKEGDRTGDVPLCPDWHDSPRLSGFVRLLTLLRGY